MLFLAALAGDDLTLRYALGESRRCGSLMLLAAKRRSDGAPVVLTLGAGAGGLRDAHLPTCAEVEPDRSVFVRPSGEPLLQRLSQGAFGPAESLKIIVQGAAALARFHGLPEPAHFGGMMPRALVRLYGERYVLDPGALIPAPAGPYAAPEAAWAQGPAADVYSLGATLFHLLTGAVPPGPAPNLGGTNLPAAVRALVMRAMAADPAARYPDAAAFRQAVEEAYDQIVFTGGARRTTSAHPPAVAPAEPAEAPAGGWRPPLWAWLAAVAVGTVAGLGGVLWVTSGQWLNRPGPPVPAVSAAASQPAAPQPAAPQPAAPQPAAPQPAAPQPAAPQPAAPQPAAPQPAAPQPAAPQPAAPQPAAPQPAAEQPTASTPPVQEPAAQQPVAATQAPARPLDTEVWIDGKPAAGGKVASYSAGNQVYLFPADFQRLFGITVTYTGDTVKLEANGQTTYTGLYYKDPWQRVFVSMDTLNLRLAGLEFRGASRNAQGDLVVQVRRAQS